MLSDLLKKENILLNLESTEKEELFAEMVEAIIHIDSSLNRDVVLRALFSREELMSTCVKKGIAIPHASISGIEKTYCILGLSKTGIDYIDEGDSSGCEPVHVVVMFIFDSNNSNEHLKNLACCAHDFQSEEFYTNLLKAESQEEVLNIVREFESQ